MNFGNFLINFGDFLRNFEKLAHCEKKIKNFHQLETNKENDILRPL